MKGSLYYFEGQKRVVLEKYNDWQMIAGNVMAFASGLFFTVNNFIIKEEKLSFGEILAVRSTLQVPLMSCIIVGGGRKRMI